MGRGGPGQGVKSHLRSRYPDSGGGCGTSAARSCPRTLNVADALTELTATGGTCGSRGFDDLTAVKQLGTGARITFALKRVCIEKTEGQGDTDAKGVASGWE